MKCPICKSERPEKEFICKHCWKEHGWNIPLYTEPVWKIKQAIKKNNQKSNIFKKLAEICGDDFKDVDPAEFVSEMRGRPYETEE